MQGEITIKAARGQVWAALNDPEMLARCIEGVESLSAEGEGRFAGTMAAKVGPVRAKFTGHVDLTELDPPNRYVLVGEGKGGVAGFARGSAEVVLDDMEDGGTLLSYVARAQVGGKLAQLGARLIEGTARGYADSFFAAFKAAVEAPGAPPEDVPADTDAMPAAGEGVALAAGEAARGLPAWAWVGGLVLLVLAVVAMLLGL